MDLKALVRTYIIMIRPKAQTELAWFRQQPNWASTLENAAYAKRSDSKRFSHQWRIQHTALEASMQVLIAHTESIQQSTSFDVLITLLEAILRPIPGIGELYIYDTALRVGAKLGLLPTKVYLHAGTRAGAKVLGLDSKSKTLGMNQLPVELRNLEPYEVEDVLCIFKGEFSKLPSNLMKKRSWCG